MQAVDHDASHSGVPSPRVSVILTTYRTPAPLLAAAIASILRQSVDDLELVLVLDGEAGEAERQVVDGVRGDDRVRLVNPGRVGRGRALNLGLQEARAPVVAIQDADDESHPHRLRRQLAVLDDHPEIGLLATAVHLTRQLDRHVDWEIDQGSPPKVRVLDRELLVRNVLIHSSVVVRRDLLASVAGYAVGRRRHFDYDMYLRIREAGGTIAVLEEPLVLRRIHDRQGFEDDAAIVERVWTTCRLQLVHAWQQPWRRRPGLIVSISIRQGGHLVRALIRRRRRTAALRGSGSSASRGR